MLGTVGSADGQTVVVMPTVDFEPQPPLPMSIVRATPDPMLSIPRLFVANLVSLLAARRAIAIYLPTLRGQRPVWDKTAHHFPEPEGCNPA